MIYIITNNDASLKFKKQTPTPTPEDTELTSRILYSLMDKVKTSEQLWNITHIYHDNRELRTTIKDEINKILLWTGVSSYGWQGCVTVDNYGHILQENVDTTSLHSKLNLRLSYTVDCTTAERQNYGSHI